MKYGFVVKFNFLILLSFICSLAYSNEEQYKIIENQLKDLELLVGQSFDYNTNQQLKVCSTNSKGEAIGEAFFKNSDPNLGNMERIAWYWHPEKGFSIIASQNALLDVYAKDHEKSFQFYEMFLNESGIVMFSFLVDQKGYNVCPQLWWSLGEGLHLSNEPTSYQLVTGLKDSGYVLIKEFLQHPSLRLHVKHFKDDEDLYTYEFDPRVDLPPGFEGDVVKMVFKYTGRRIKKVTHFNWGAFVIDEFSDFLNIKGHALVTMELSGRIWPIFWHAYINYEICNGNAKFMVETITEAFVNHPRSFTDIDNKVIFEKNFLD